MAAVSPVVRPRWGWFVLLDGGLVLLSTVSFSGRAHGRVAGIGPLPGRGALQRLLGVAVAVHVVEAVAAARGARRRALSVRGWALQTLVVGFPSLLALRRTGAST